MRDLNLPPYAPTLIESIRAIGYTLEAALADIIDNGISATASHVDIFFFPTGESYVAVLDDGNGMTGDELNSAMRYGSQNPNKKRTATDLGRFGLGLKTASLSQCRVLTVASKQGEHIEARRWDIDHVIATDNWSLLILESEEEINSIPRIEKLRELSSGTLVVWQNLDRLKIGELNFDQSLGKKMDDVRSHISFVFHRYLNGDSGLKRVQIKMNNIIVTPADPFLERRNTQAMSDEHIVIDGVTVTVRPFILPHVSNLSKDELASLGGKEGLRKSQGFYIYRNKRLLTWGSWLRMMRQGELSKLARVQVDIPNALDHLWTLDIKKSTAVPPEIVRNQLGSIIERIANKSKQTWVYRGKRETDSSSAHIWHRFKGREGGFYYSINRDHPLVELLCNSSPQIKQNFESVLKAIELGIPLNQLYLDLTSEKQVENDIKMNYCYIEDILKQLLAQVTTDAARLALLKKLAVADPFVHYPHLIEKFENQGINNG